MQSTAQLEFWETHKNNQFMNFLAQANEYLKTIAVDQINNAEEDEKSSIDDLLADVEAQIDKHCFD